MVCRYLRLEEKRECMPTSMIQEQKFLKWRLFTSFEEVTRIPWVKNMEKEMIPKRAITVCYDGPIKHNVIPEGMLKDIKQNL